VPGVISTAPSVAWLTPVAGPPLPPIALQAEADGQTIGRHESCSIILPPDAEQVSRQHARFDADETGWRVVDLGSRWGTLVNGVKLQPRMAMPISADDRITIAPWTFSFTIHKPRRGLSLSDDTSSTIIRTLHDRESPLADDLLKLLLDASAAIHAATTEQELAATVLSVAKRGTGLSNAVLLRPTDGLSAFDVVAADMPPGKTSAAGTFSRSLVTAAAHGEVAEIEGGAGDAYGQSLLQMNVTAAICAPLMLGAAPAAFLYLDSRGGPPRMLRPNGSSFCAALARVASLALANMKRLEMEKRQSRIDAEMHAAAAAQKWIMPPREQTVAGLRIVGESRPGQYVGGDFFDVIRLADGKIGIALGDVSGKGVAASVLMTLTQGFLHAALLESGDPASAVTRLNAFIAPRRPASKFVTLWCGVIDPAAGQIHYVDAAHGYGLLRRRDGTVVPLNEGGGLPIGVMDDGIYEAEIAPFSAGDTLVVVSDGIVEQPAHGAEPRVEFGVEGVETMLASDLPDAVAALFAAVDAHARGEKLADDATALTVSL